MRRGRLIYASSENCSDIAYAGGFSAPDPFIYFSISGLKGLVVTSLEHGRACNEAKKGVRVFNRDEFVKREDGPIKPERIILEVARRFEVEEWVVPNTFPVGVADSLRANDMIVTAEKGEFFSKRVCKTKAEITKITRALRVAERAMEVARGILRESSVDDSGDLMWHGRALTSDLLRAEIEMSILRDGGTASRTIVACGTDGAEPHNIGTGVIRAEKGIIIDIFPKMIRTGYWGDITRTFVKGKAPKTLKKAYEAVKEARDRSKKHLKTGVSASSAYKKALEILDKHGFKTKKLAGRDVGFIHGLGHGVGLDIHEAPTISPLNSALLESGNVVTVEPGVYYPEWGGVRLEDMGVVRADGFECLTAFDNTLEVE